MSTFHFKEFSVQQGVNTHKIGTDAMLLGAFIDASKHLLGLDIGAGTGVLGLMIAQRNPTIHLTCLEIDQRSAAECASNIKQSPWANRITTKHLDFKCYSPRHQFDLIFTNPPFYFADNSSGEDNLRTKHTTIDRLAEWISKIKELLTPEGEFWVIWPSETSEQVIDIASNNKLFVSKKIAIYSKANNLSRTILCFRSNLKSSMEEETFIIRNDDNSYSSDYCRLTSDFHFTPFNSIESDKTTRFNG